MNSRYRSQRWAENSRLWCFRDQQDLRCLSRPSYRFIKHHTAFIPIDCHSHVWGLNSIGMSCYDWREPSMCRVTPGVNLNGISSRSRPKRCAILTNHSAKHCCQMKGASHEATDEHIELRWWLLRNLAVPLNFGGKWEPGRRPPRKLLTLGTAFTPRYEGINWPQIFQTLFLCECHAYK